MQRGGRRNKKRQPKWWYQSSESSTPSSTPSVEDEIQQLVPEGASGTPRDGSGSRSPHGQLEGDGSGRSPGIKKRQPKWWYQSSESSTPSVEDENRQLVPEGASGDGSGSRSPHGQLEGDCPGRSPGSSTGTILKRSSQAGHSSEMQHLIPPHQESRTLGPKQTGTRQKVSGTHGKASNPSKSDENRQHLAERAWGASSDGHRSRSPQKTRGNVRRPRLTRSKGSPKYEGTKTEKKHPMPPGQDGGSSPQSPKRFSDIFAPTASQLDGQADQSKLSDLKKLVKECNIASQSSSGSKKSSSDSPGILRRGTDGPQSSSSTDQSSELFKASKTPEMSFLTVPGQWKPSSPLETGQESSRSPSKSSLLGKTRDGLLKSPNRSGGDCKCRDKSKHGLNCPLLRKDFTKADTQSRSRFKSEESSDSSSPRIDEGNISSKSSKSSSLTDSNALQSSSSCEGNRPPRDSLGNDSLIPDNRIGSNSEEGTSSDQRVRRNLEKFEKLQLQSPGVRKRPSSYKSCLPIHCLGCDRSPSPSGDSVMEELRRPLNVNIGSTSGAEDEREAERRCLERMVSARPNASVRRSLSKPPLISQICTCKGKAPTFHSIDCPLWRHLRYRRKVKICRQEVPAEYRRRSPRTEDAGANEPRFAGATARRPPSRSPQSRPSKERDADRGRYKKLENKGQDADSYEDKKSESGDDEKSS